MGAAVLTGSGVAWAHPASDATDSTTDSSTGASASRGGDAVATRSNGHRRWTTFPGVQGTQQGRQDFALVDPTTDAVVGNFSALVTAGDPTGPGAHYVQLQVTGDDGANVGTGPGQTPAVGTVLSVVYFGSDNVS